MGSTIDGHEPGNEGADPDSYRGFSLWSSEVGSASIGGMNAGPVLARPDGVQTVLVVDDHEGFRTRTRRLLEQHRYRVVEAGDGAQALARAASERPDLVLLDVNLPDTDGFAVAIGLRRAGTTGAILLVSTHSAIDYADRVRDSAADGFIDKADLSAATIAAALALHP